MLSLVVWITLWFAATSGEDNGVVDNKDGAHVNVPTHVSFDDDFTDRPIENAAYTYEEAEIVISDLVNLERTPEKIHMSYVQFLRQSERRVEASVQPYYGVCNHTDCGKVELYGKLKFDGIVDADSLTNVLGSTVGLCIHYIRYSDYKIFYFRGSAVFINVSHLITARHNTYECMIKTAGGNFVECITEEEFNSIDSLKFAFIDVSFNEFHCYSGVDITSDDITVAAYDESQKGKQEYYGSRIEKSMVDDVAVMKSPLQSKWFVELHNVPDLDSFAKIMVVGYPPKFRPQTLYSLHPDGPRVNGERLTKFFGDAKHVAYGISDDKVWIDTSGKIVMGHHVATWGGFSGSGIYYVDRSGLLHCIGVHVGGWDEWNYGITTNHLVLQQIIQTQSADKDEL